MAGINAARSFAEGGGREIMSESKEVFWFGFLCGCFGGMVLLAIFIGNLSRLMEWTSGGAYRREQEIRDFQRSAEFWRNRHAALVEINELSPEARRGTE